MYFYFTTHDNPSVKTFWTYPICIVLLDDITYIYVWTDMFAYFTVVVFFVQCARGPNQRLVLDQQITQQRSLETLTDLYFTVLYYFGLEYTSI